jgi:hypothetical protein
MRASGACRAFEGSFSSWLSERLTKGKSSVSRSAAHGLAASHSADSQ